MSVIVTFSKEEEEHRRTEHMSDYTDKYITDGYFDLHRLINDDFVVAIKMTWNERHYTSCLKLLVSFVDTMAFIEHGNSSGDLFRQWLNAYVDLSNVGITAEELWEHRNAVLHMTTYDSHKVLAGKVAKLVPYNGMTAPRGTNKEFKYYSLHTLIMAVMKGVGNYVATIDRDDQMRRRFCENYEKTVSDSNFSTAEYQEQSDLEV